VATRRVLATRQLRCMTVGADDLDVGVGAGRKLPRTLLPRMEQPESCQVRQLQRPARFRSNTRDAAESVGANIAKLVGIRRRADAE